jgi:hypothetical protein
MAQAIGANNASKNGTILVGKSTTTAAENVIHYGGNTAGGAIVGGVIGSAAGPAGTIIGSVVGAIGGIYIAASGESKGSSA